MSFVLIIHIVVGLLFVLTPFTRFVHSMQKHSRTLSALTAAATGITGVALMTNGASLLAVCGRFLALGAAMFALETVVRFSERLAYKQPEKS